MNKKFLVMTLSIVMSVFFCCSDDNADDNSFVAVTGISGVTTVAEVNKPQTLTASVSPTDATNQIIVWTVKEAGTTSASITGNTLTATAMGTVTVTATIANGATKTTAFAANFSIEVKSATAMPVITGVTVSPSTANTAKGGSQKFTATVTGTNLKEEDNVVNWTVTGGTKTGTAIGADGTLKVAEDETATSLTVKATSAVDNTKSGTATITVTEGSSVVNVSTVEQLKSAITAGGVKTIQLAAGEYVVKAIRGSSTDNGLMPRENSNITILPPASGTATIRATADTNGDIFQVNKNAILTLGQEGSGTGNIVIDGSQKPSTSNSSATGHLVSVYSEGGKFTMYNKVSLSNNSSSAVMVNAGGTFEMKGGVIYNNRSISDGAGVIIYDGKFIMEGGTISNNTAYHSTGTGGGVKVGFASDVGSFIMKGGEIIRNVAGNRGGGVCVRTGNSFIFEGGTIKGYSASDGDSNKAGASNTSGAALYVEAGGSASDGISGFIFPTSTNSTITR